MSYPAGRGRADFLDLGDYNTVCYQCGRKRKASYLVRHWQGYYVCPEHNEPRQDQDFVRSVPDVQTVPWAQPLNIVGAARCTPNSTTAIPGFAGPGCVIPGYISPMFDPTITVVTMS